LARDNLPVLGWLLLRGRCRYCCTCISARYPLVEFAAGLVFTALCLGEAVFQGATLPIPPLMAEQLPLFGIAVYHFALLCGLGAAALMAYDGAVVPVAFWRVILLIGLVPPLVWSDLRPIHFSLTYGAYGRLAIGLADGALGGLLGALLGAVSWPTATIRARARSGHLNSVAALACVGSFLGWQAVAAVGLAAAGLVLVRAVLQVAGFGSGRVGLAMPFIAALAFILGWNQLASHLIVRKSSLLGPAAPLWFALAAVAGTFACSLAARPLLLGGTAPSPSSSRSQSSASPP
jgi:prepilin signal peptidase PulO-like enzyme (type II secretory pathway)